MREKNITKQLKEIANLEKGSQTYKLAELYLNYSVKYNKIISEQLMDPVASREEITKI